MSAPAVRRWPDRASDRAPAPLDRAAWRTFLGTLLALSVALLLALYSSSAAQAGQLRPAAASAFAALAMAGWVAFTVVPRLARRAAWRWSFRVDYRLTREGGVYLAGVFIVALAALNTGNNLLFLVLASQLAGILISGIVSQIILTGVELRLELPEHIFAGRPVLALAELINHKRTLPSFSLRLVGLPPKSSRPAASEILTVPVCFPHLPRRQSARQSVELAFPRRGIYRQEALGLRTRFPFGFLEKTRAVDSRLEAVVYPAVEPAAEFYEILPLLGGEMESLFRGRGHDLYGIRDYQTTDTSRHVDWKASAKRGVLQVREFAREDERRVLLALDPSIPASLSGTAEVAALFDRGVEICASLAWHFHELDAALMFCAAGFEAPMARAGENIYAILHYLATAEPGSAESAQSLFDELAGWPQIFKIIVTAQPRGSISSRLWDSSYVVFLNS